MSNELIKDAEESQSIEKTASENVENINPAGEAVDQQAEQAAAPAMQGSQAAATASEPGSQAAATASEQAAQESVANAVEAPTAPAVSDPPAAQTAETVAQ